MPTSWRDTASEQAQDQLDALLGEGLFQAEAMVRKHGEFYPFAFIWPTGSEQPEAVMVYDDPEGRDRPDSAALIEKTVIELQSRRDDLDATALVTDVYLNGQPAISIALEHRDGIHLTVARFYRRKRLGRGGVLGDLTGYESDAQVWT